MKKIYLILLCLASLCIGCDKIEGPFMTAIHPAGGGGVFPPSGPEFEPLDTSAVYRKILMEEYTGHYCTNCPDGHTELERLHGIYGDTLVIVGIHSGSLAAPQMSNPDFSYNFCTEAGDELHSYFNIDAIPAAIINRFNSIWSVQRWPSKLAAADRTKYAAIQLINQYGLFNSQTLRVDAKVTMLADYPNPVRLSLFLIENDVVKPQLQHSETILEYHHQHVLRAGINGTFGDYLTSDGILKKNESYTYARTISFAGHDWNIDNCYVVAILHDKVNGEVLQVEQLKAN